MNKNRFDGLRFRIMETLEKAKGVPLTAREVGLRLHADEYKDQLQDNVLWRVTNSIHALKGQGKVLLHDSRGEGGQLTYVLPQRLAFSQRKDDTPPANPVLKPELAEKIRTTEPKEPAPPKRPIFGVGVPEKVVEYLDKAPYPQAVPEIVEALGDLWSGHYKGSELNNAYAGVMYQLFKDRRIKRVSSSKRVPQVQYEYFTNKTKTKVYVPDAPTVPVKNYVEVPPKNKKLMQVEEPVTKPNSKPAIAESWDRQVSQKQPLFRPGARPTKDTEFKIRIAQSMYDDWKADAERFGVSLSQFVIDAVEFARSYAGEE